MHLELAFPEAEGKKNQTKKIALESEIGLKKINEVTRLLKWKISLMSF
jgi:hypothetical protein